MNSPAIRPIGGLYPAWGRAVRVGANSTSHRVTGAIVRFSPHSR